MMSVVTSDVAVLKNISNNVFIIKALKSLKEQSRKHHDVYEATQKALELIMKATESKDSQVLPPPKKVSECIMLPLRLAVASRVLALQIIALDCIQKIIAYAGQQAHMSPHIVVDGLIMDISSIELVNLVCSCYSDDNVDSQVDLQIIKALVTIISSTMFQVHGEYLLKAVRTIFKIHLHALDPLTQTTAKGTLTQVINMIFQRIDNPLYPNNLSRPRHSKATMSRASTSSETSTPSRTSDGLASRKSHELKNGSSTPQLDENGHGKISSSSSISSTTTSDLKGKLPERSNSSLEQSRGSKTLDDDQPLEASDKQRKEGRYGQCIVCNKAADKFCFETQNPVCSIACKDVHLERMKVVMEPFAMVQFTDEFNNVLNEQITFKSDWERDAFLVFRSLCLVSASEVSDLHHERMQDTMSREYRGKLLSLVLIYEIVHQLTAVIRRHGVFIFLIKHYLFVSLIRNGVSNMSGIFSATLNIVLALLYGFRGPLKLEIGLYFKKMLLPLLELKTIGFQECCVLLDIIDRLGSDPQVLVDLYLNYDCDLYDMENVFERMVHALSKLAQSRPSLTQSVPTELDPVQLQELTISMKSRDCLIHLVHSLLTWSQSAPLTDGTKSPISLTSPSRRSSSATESDLLSASMAKASLLQDDSPAVFAERIHFKKALEQGISLFNTNARKGLQFLFENDCVKEDPEDIVKFFLYTRGLNKRMIGHYLGDAAEFNANVLRLFCEQFDLSGLPLMTALRQFLEKLTPSGEAQKIDRIIYRFSERYHVCNPRTYDDPDVSYKLVYAAIVLNTDLYNPMNRSKQTKSEFLSLANEMNLPQQQLDTIYDDISQHELRSRDDRLIMDNLLTRKKSASMTQEALKRDMASRAEALFQKKESVAPTDNSLSTEPTLLSSPSTGSLMDSLRYHGNTPSYLSGTRPEHVQAMFELVWMPLLVALTAALQDSQEDNTIQLSLSAFQEAVRITCVFAMEVPKQAFLFALGKFTLLPELKQKKNYEVVACMLSIAAQCGDQLDTSWLYILRCMSELDKSHQKSLLASTATAANVTNIAIDAKYDVVLDDPKRSPSSSSSAMSTSAVRSRVIYRVVDPVAVLSPDQYQTFQVTIDQLLMRSDQLRMEALAAMVHAMTLLSADEITATSDHASPHLYTLMRLVDVAYYNLSRTGWPTLWLLYRPHLVRVGQHPNMAIAEAAIHALRQIALKFLEAPRTDWPAWQEELLAPYATLYEATREPRLREMIVRCVQQMIQARAEQLAGGWQVIFALLLLAAQDVHESVVMLVHDCVRFIQKECLLRVLMHRGGYLSYLTVLYRLAMNHAFHRIGLQALEVLRQVTDQLVAVSHHHNELLSVSRDDVMALTHVDVPESLAESRFWVPLLMVYQRLALQSDAELRVRALSYMFEALKAYGKTFELSFSLLLYRSVLVHLFDYYTESGRQSWTAATTTTAQLSSLSLDRREGSPVTYAYIQEWLSTVSMHALKLLTEWLSANYDVFIALGDDALVVYRQTVLMGSEMRAKDGCLCWITLIRQNMLRMDDAVWTRVCRTVLELMRATSPQDLYLIGDELKQVREHFAQYMEKRNRDIVSKCVMQLVLLQLVDDLLAGEHAIYPHLKASQLLLLLSAVESAYEFAYEFHSNFDLRASFVTMGMMKHPPNLLKQETSSMNILIPLLFRMYGDEREWVPDVEDKLFAYCKRLIATYNDFQEEKNVKDIAMWSPTIMKVLVGIQSLQDDQFKHYMNEFYPDMVDLLTRDMDKDVRLALKTVLMRTAQLFNIRDGQSLHPPSAHAASPNDIDK